MSDTTKEQSKVRWLSKTPICYECGKPHTDDASVSTPQQILCPCRCGEVRDIHLCTMCKETQVVTCPVCSKKSCVKDMKDGMCLNCGHKVKPPTYA